MPQMTKPNPNKVALRPLPMRITPIQYSRLQDARIRDGRTIQEHIRKALDLYLDGLDKALARANGVATTPASSAAGAVPKVLPVAAKSRARPVAPAVRQR